MVISLIPLFAETTNPLSGVWSNGSRFVEFSPDGRMRFVLKTYYGFVYEDRAWLPYSVTPLVFGAAPVGDAPADVSANGDPSSCAYVLSLRYPKEKTDAEIPLAVIGDAIYFRFYRKADPSGLIGSAATAQSAGATEVVSGKGKFDGFWIAAGNQDALMLYRADPASEFFSFYFRGSDYYRIRYWATDARPRDVGARFVSRDGTELFVPKFIEIGSTLYTCVSSTGKVLRNYESGTFEATDGALAFKPSAIAYAGTAAAILKPLSYTVSPDGSVLALGDPYLARSKVADLSAEITAHNALRRPPRKPIFGFMKLNFYWDEIERIRNNGKIPEKAGK
jgi:hypothetical protein